MVLLGCSPPSGKPEWTYARDAVIVRINADSTLNVYEDQPHTVRLVLYQLTARDAFDEYAATREGLQALLECERFDPSVVAFDNVTVRPGEKRTLRFDRSEEARWVGAVAGYYRLTPGLVSRVADIPVVYGRKWVVRELIEMTGLIPKKNTARAGDLFLDLVLSPHTLHQVSPRQ